MLPRHAPVQYHAQSLLDALKRAHCASNASLQALAQAGKPELRCAEQAGFCYQVPLAPPRTIAAALFHRPYALQLESLELLICGYCCEQQFGWERKQETVFSTCLPPWWRRLLRPAPMLALKIASTAEGRRIAFEGAPAGTKPNKSRYLIRLEADLRADLAHAHRRQVAQHATLLTRFLAWCRNARRRNATAPETDM